jgi:hypothetical protein
MQLAAMALQHAMPPMAQYGDLAASGGLMGYGSEHYRCLSSRWGLHRPVLKGEKPADLPVQARQRAAR